MKRLILALCCLMQITLFSQADSVHLIPPIYEGPQMTRAQMITDRSLAGFRSWAIEKMGVDSLLYQQYTGAGIKVCVCDTGRPTHSDLKNALSESKNFTSDASVDDAHGHATHVSGIINEIGNSIEILSAKVLNNYGSGSPSGVAAGILWCKDMGADIINLSLGMPTPQGVMYNAVKEVTDAGITVICAAGNSGQSETENRIGYPANWSETWAIGSINKNGEVSYFSSSGPSGDIVAPGEKILSTWTNETYREISGTSMAAPFVSATIALYIEKKENNGVREKYNHFTKDILPEGYDNAAFNGIPVLKEIFADTTGGKPLPEPDPDPGDPEPKTPLNIPLVVIIAFGVIAVAVFIWILKNRSKK